MSASVRVATYNLYLGADLSLLFAVPDEETLRERLAEVLRQLDVTAFPARARAIARLIVRERLDVVGLQEVSTWEVDGHVLWDFRQCLLDALAELGEPYDLVSEVATFTGAGRVPLPSGESTIRVTGANEILRRRSSPYAAVRPARGVFRDALTLAALDGVSVSITRGWCSVECSDGAGASFTFVNTHTEAYEETARNAQRDELVAGLPADGPLVLVGDFNSSPDRVGLPDGLVDAWLVGAAHPDRDGVTLDGADGATCGQTADLSNEQSTLRDRIDYVWVRGLSVRETHRAGLADRDRTERGTWPSDHVAVVAELRFEE